MSLKINQSKQAKKKKNTKQPQTHPSESGESRSVVSDSLQRHGILQARILEWVDSPKAS